jgi:C-terminal processing protease CtpA/Prc
MKCNKNMIIKISNIFFIVIASTIISSCGIKKYTTTMEQMMITETKDIVYREKEIAVDIDYLIKSVEEVSPFPYMNADSLSIQKLAMDLKSKGDRKGNELYLDFMRLSAAFNVGHIYTFPPEAMLDEAIQKGDRFFPLFLKKNQGKWEILGIIDSAISEKNIGNEVLKINGKEIGEIVKTIQPCLANDGNTEEIIGASLPFLMWAVNISHPYSVEIIIKETGLSEAVQLQGTNDLAKYRTQKPSESNLKLEDFISFQLLDKYIGYINAKSFGFAQYNQITKSFEKELESYFSELKAKGVSNLIIDLRENGGGSSYPAEAILQKITQKPYQQSGGSTIRVSTQFKEFLNNMPSILKMFALKGAMKNYDKHPIGTNIVEKTEPSMPKKTKNSFSGQVYALIGPNTSSAAMMMANAMEDFDLGILVGESTLSIPRDLSNALPLKTPNSKIAFVVPATLFTRASGDANNFEPVKPDVVIETKTENISGKYDAVMNYVLEKIRTK